MHSCVNLSWLPGEAVTAKRLAAFYDLPTAYLNKQLQALTRAGILSSVSGPKGGFQLARDPRNITLLDIGPLHPDPEGRARRRPQRRLPQDLPRFPGDAGRGADLPPRAGRYDDRRHRRPGREAVPRHA